MIKIIGTNIISSLGFTTEENFAAVKAGISGVKHYNVGVFDLPEAFMASLIDKENLNDKFAEMHCVSTVNMLTLLEKAAILSIFSANKTAQIDLSSEKTIFILSTTKGNVDLLNNTQANHALPEQAYLWKTAKIINDFFKNPNTPIVVSNACISGAAAQIAAMRELETGNYEHAVVAGVDFLSKFIISGFQSFKALSPELCRPFDKDRCGLNLGEATATMIFQNNKQETKNQDIEIQLIAGAIRNDANHISAPSRTGEGSCRALNYILSDKNLKSEIAFINAHGTATPYNDAMEAQAITRAGLETVFVNSLKSYFGHTLGAAGVLECVISIKALESGIVLPNLNFHSQDIEFQLNIAQKIQKTDKKYFIKMMSGFGGVNAALLFGYEK
ncbi:MAG: beta-ketoacyl synthase [Paludibacter sp.]|nr:beta-ketoacyl synthase [Paludibacter sp.]